MKTVFSPETQKKIDYILPRSTYLEKYLLLGEIRKELNTYDSAHKDTVNTSGYLTSAFIATGVISTAVSDEFNFFTALSIFGTFAMGSLFIKESILYSQEKQKHNAFNLISSFYKEEKLKLDDVDKVYNSPYQQVVLLLAKMNIKEARQVRYRNYVSSKISKDFARELQETDTFPF